MENTDKARLESRIARYQRNASEEEALDRVEAGLERLSAGIDDELAKLFEGTRPSSQPLVIPVTHSTTTSSATPSSQNEGRSSFSNVGAAPSLEDILKLNPKERANAEPSASPPSDPAAAQKPEPQTDKPQPQTANAQPTPQPAPAQKDPPAAVTQPPPEPKPAYKIYKPTPDVEVTEEDPPSTPGMSGPGRTLPP